MTVTVGPQRASSLLSKDPQRVPRRARLGPDWLLPLSWVFLMMVAWLGEGTDVGWSGVSARAPAAGTLQGWQGPCLRSVLGAALGWSQPLGKPSPSRSCLENRPGPVDEGHGNRELDLCRSLTDDVSP